MGYTAEDFREDLQTLVAEAHRLAEDVDELLDAGWEKVSPHPVWAQLEGERLRAFMALARFAATLERAVGPLVAGMGPEEEDDDA